MVERQVFRLSVLFLLSQVRFHRVAGQCINGESESSVLGWKLQGHTYKKMAANVGLECALECQRDEICQSLNFVLSTGICEFNNRTKEARPKDFVPVQDALYFKRLLGRSENLLLISFPLCHHLLSQARLKKKKNIYIYNGC